jgi:hypothetical protein
VKGTEGKNWRDQILREFTPQVARLTIVADPDGLLTEEGIILGLRERGFELILFDDPVAFRFVYESKYRSCWDHGEPTDLVVVLRAATQDLHALPYDLLQTGRQLSFQLGDLFPNLSYPVIVALDRGDLDALYRAQHQQNPGKLGDNATKDFVLRHVFEVAPEVVKRPPDLLRILLRRHYQGQRVPAVLDERFIQVLRQNGTFDDWPLESIIPDRHAFLTFLQERWPYFVRRWLTQKDPAHIHRTQAIAESETESELAAPLDLPFDHDDVRVYIDNLFVEGYLKPVSIDEIGLTSSTIGSLTDWISVGLHTDQEEEQARRFEWLMQSVETSLPQSDARHQEWLTFAHRWAELIVLYHSAMSAVRSATNKEPYTHLAPRTRHLYRELQEKVDTVFLTWVQKRYTGLHNLPAIPPVMLHHIPRYLAQLLSPHHSSLVTHHCEKVALLVLDGLALDQWLVLHEVLTQQRPQLRFHDEAVFAWIPTITTVSRQSIFAGKPPLYYPASIWTTEREAALWTRFWADQGLSPVEVGYAKGLGDLSTLTLAEEVATTSQVRVGGLIVDMVDKIMHGMQLGMAGMHDQIRQWGKQEFLAQLLDLLLDRDFVVFLTSDHGNLEAEGYGQPQEGVIADLRGERARVYSEHALRARVKERFPDAIMWPPVGLPEDYLPLLAPGRVAFVQEGERIVGHGGISPEEVIVPFVRIERAHA